MKSFKLQNRVIKKGCDKYYPFMLKKTCKCQQSHGSQMRLMKNKSSARYAFNTCLAYKEGVKWKFQCEF